MKLYFGTTDKYAYSSDMSEDYVKELLGKWRGEKVLKVKAESARALPFCAGMTLKEAFLDNGIDLVSVIPTIGENEKPIAKELSFNLSHSGKVALVAVLASGEPIGCDIQVIGDKPFTKLFKIAERFFSVRECEILQEIFQKDPNAARKLFYFIFSAKEAYIKLTGEGMKRGLDTFETPLEGVLESLVAGRQDDVVVSTAHIDGNLIEFTFLLPGYIKERTSDSGLYNEYVSVICVKS